MNDELSFRDPHKRQTITLKTVPTDRLTVVEHQRKTRPSHGEHRLEAAREVGIRKVPVLVVPQGLAPRMMNLNVEKDLNIREKATVSLGIYRAALDANPELKETDPEIKDSIETAYYVTLGLAYEKGSRLAGSAFEPLLKKCDFFLRRTIENAYPAREERAGRVIEANTLVKDVIAKAKEMGAFHQ